MNRENESRFSPASHLLRSPKELNRSGNLTGSERKIKDGVADLYNGVQKWKNVHTSGINIVNTIANIKLQHLYNEDEESKNQIPLELEHPCSELKTVIQKLEKIIMKLELVGSMFIGVRKLEQHLGDDTILFQTWTIDDFVTSGRNLVDMYKEELRLKELIYQNICHAKDRNSMMFYTSSWLHQPYIGDSSEVIMESLLLETGHKKLPI